MYTDLVKNVRMSTISSVLPLTVVSDTRRDFTRELFQASDSDDSRSSEEDGPKYVAVCCTGLYLLTFISLHIEAVILFRSILFVLPLMKLLTNFTGP
jgi:hypothetical protein